MQAATIATALQVAQEVSLAPFTTLGVGGPARLFCEVREEAQLFQALELAERGGHRIGVFGGGSNLLVADAGFDGLMLRIAIAGEPVVREEGNEVLYVVPAGMEWERLVSVVCEAGLSGIECLAGIPGLTGGTPVQNVGAYGQEVAQTIREVRVWDRRQRRFVELDQEACGFRYRTSIFNSTERDRYIVTAVTFAFNRSARPALNYPDLRQVFEGRSPSPVEVAEAVRGIRQKKGMLLVAGDPDSRSAGSFFKNPIVAEGLLASVSLAGGVAEQQVPHWPAGPGEIKLSAAWLVERAGFPRGFAQGRAGISSRHSLAVINRGGAMAAEIVALRDRIQADVERRFRVRLEQEPVAVGF